MQVNGKHRFGSRATQARRPERIRAGNDGDPLRELLGRLAALVSYVSHYAALKVDAAGVRVRNLVLFILLGAIGVVVLTIIVLSFWFYLLGGVAGGLSVAVGDRRWLGDLLAGGFGLVIVLGVLAAVAARVRNKKRRERIRKHEERKARQRIRYGAAAEDDGRVAA
jgi:hypothetical protein